MAGQAGEAAVPFFGSAKFAEVAYEAGNLTAEALDASGARLAKHSVHSGGAAAQIRLSLDAPSPITGTGCIPQRVELRVRRYPSRNPFQNHQTILLKQ